MGKLTSFNGVATGKVGSNVFSVVSGQQIVRSYQPNVANPSTSSQVNARARLKLMSQLAADLSPVIAMPKEGMVTRRNNFISKNYDYVIANNGIAQITYENVQLAQGNKYLPAIQATRTAEVGVTVAFASAVNNINRAVFIIAKKTEDNRLSVEASQIVEDAGENMNYQTTFPIVDGEIVIFAYGMADTNASASAKYGNMQVQSASDLATLVATRSLTSSDYVFTKTRGATMDAAGNIIEPTPSGDAKVYVTTSGNGTATGAGTFAIGSQVTVTATPAANNNFKGWYINGDFTNPISTSASYTFTLRGLMDLVAVFEAAGSGGGGGLE